MRSNKLLPVLRSVLVLGLVSSCVAQSRSPVPALTTADYARAEQFMTYSTTPLVSARTPHLAKGRSLLYRDATPQGNEFVLVDAATGKRTALFEHSKLAATLSSAASASYEANRLPFDQVELSPDGQNRFVQPQRPTVEVRCTKDRSVPLKVVATRIARSLRDRPFRARLVSSRCASPDGKLTAFIRN